MLAPNANKVSGNCSVAPTRFYKMPFHLSALHNPNPLEFLFTKPQTPQLRVKHLFVCSDDNFQNLLFLFEDINTQSLTLFHVALAECNYALMSANVLLMRSCTYSTYGFLQSECIYTVGYGGICFKYFEQKVLTHCLNMTPGFMISPS